MAVMRVAGAQLPNMVGDLDGNVERITEAMQWAEEEAHADVLVVPELALTGYPLEDLVLHDEFVAEARSALDRLAARSGRLTTVVSTIDRVPPQRSWDTRNRDVAISAAVLSGGEIRGFYHKVLLPVYDVFDEARNFAHGRRPDALWRIGDVAAGICICEDMWSGDGPPEAQSAAGARILLVPNASPYHRGKAASRLRFASSVARRNGVPLVYVNLVGGQDELVFDGGSLILDADGQLVYRAAEFREDNFVVDVPVAPERPITGPVTTVHTRPLRRPTAVPAPPPAPARGETAGVWEALVLAARDFARKNGFSNAVLGLSGGIDSAVTAAVAADALGPANVLGVAMPASDSPSDEQRDAEKLAANLGIDFETIPIGAIHDALIDGLRRRVGRRTAEETRIDLYARARAAILSAISDEQGHLVLATGNKSELSIGEAALAGDLVGGFAPLRDCPKTLLYELARHRNREGVVIPEETLRKQTTAQRMGPESPPPYVMLDPIVERYVEYGQSLEEIVAAGFDPDVTLWVLRRVDDAEYKRRLTPPGVKITARAYDQDRRMPISNAWRAHRRAVRTVPGTR